MCKALQISFRHHDNRMDSPECGNKNASRLRAQQGPGVVQNNREHFLLTTRGLNMSKTLGDSGSEGIEVARKHQPIPLS